jgi:hypothetical protein
MNTTPSYDDSSTAQAVRSQALGLARDLEARQHDADFLEVLYEDTLEVNADTRGQVVLVLGTGGPHTELRLGIGQPTVVVYWGGEKATCPVFLDPSVLDDSEVGLLWHSAMARSLGNPPYEG